MVTIQRLYALAKYSLGLKNYKCKKGGKNDCATTLELLCEKNGSKKQLILEKWEHFEDGQNWPQCKGYSPCKILTLGQKLKMQKRCEKRFYDHITVVVCKKALQKAASIRKMRAFRNWLKIATIHGYSPFKILTLAPKLKMQKRWEKRL